MLAEVLKKYGFPKDVKTNMTGDFFEWSALSQMEVLSISIQYYSNKYYCKVRINGLTDSKQIKTESDWLAVRNFIVFLKKE